jgi:hypothetical protein
VQPLGQAAEKREPALPLGQNAVLQQPADNERRSLMWGGHLGYDGGFFFFPFIAGILWIVAVIYVLYLGSRLVRAVERIADRIEEKKKP